MCYVGLAGSPAPLNVLQQAAEAELAKVAQDHAPAQTPLPPAADQPAQQASSVAANSGGGRRPNER